MAPLALSCGHGVSKQALSDICAQTFLLGRDSPSRAPRGGAAGGIDADLYSVDCPTCQRPTELSKHWLEQLQSEDSLLQLRLYITENGLEGLSDHSKILALVEQMERIGGDTQEFAPCDVCAQPALHWCERCDASLCDNCDAAEHVTTLTQRHQRVALSARPPPVPTCAHHDAPLELYCESCLEFACVQCCESKTRLDGTLVQGKHTGPEHRVKELDTTAAPKRQLHQRHAQGLGARCGVFEALRAGLQQQKGALQEEASAAKASIEREFTKLDEIVRTALQARRLALLDEVDQQLACKSAVLQRQDVDLLECLARLYTVLEAKSKLAARDHASLIEHEEAVIQLSEQLLSEVVSRPLPSTVDVAPESLLFEASKDFGLQLVAGIEKHGVVGMAAPPELVACMGSDTVLVLTLHVPETGLELEVNSVPLPSPDAGAMVLEWLTSADPELPGAQQFNISGYTGSELSAKLEGLLPCSLHAFRVRAKEPQQAWGDWSEVVVYQTLSRLEDGRRPFEALEPVTLVEREAS